MKLKDRPNTHYIERKTVGECGVCNEDKLIWYEAYGAYAALIKSGRVDLCQDCSELTEEAAKMIIALS